MIAKDKVYPLGQPSQNIPKGRVSEITNGIVNLQVTTPSAQSDWVLNVSYLYNTTLLFSQGTCDYVF